MIRYAAFDLDGTLLDPSGVVVRGVGEGLRRLRDLGVTPMIVSGRSYPSFARLGLPDSLLEHVDPEVLLNDGNVRYDRRTGEVSSDEVLPAAVVGRLRDAGVRDLVVDTGERLVARSRRAAVMYAMAYDVARSIVPVEPDADHAGWSPVAVTAFSDAASVSALLGDLPHELRRIGSFGASVVLPVATCKATALVRHVERRFGERDLQRTAAFGDGYNDGCMLGAAAIGVAMRGCDEVASECAAVQLSVPLGDFLSRLDHELLAGLRAGAAETVVGCSGRHRKRPDADVRSGSRHGLRPDRQGAIGSPHAT